MSRSVVADGLFCALGDLPGQHEHPVDNMIQVVLRIPSDGYVRATDVGGPETKFGYR